LSVINDPFYIYILFFKKTRRFFLKRFAFLGNFCFRSKNKKKLPSQISNNHFKTSPIIFSSLFYIIIIKLPVLGKPLLSWRPLWRVFFLH